MFQSTHPHGVRRVGNITMSGNIYMFQSTHPHGVRLCLPRIKPQITRFNPRTHTGCDMIQFHNNIPKTVSIHAPTRGATLSIGSICFKTEVSIHAPTRGATSSADIRAPNCRFQSTHPHGVRHGRIFSPRKARCFNPRTHTGCDLASKPPS